MNLLIQKIFVLFLFMIASFQIKAQKLAITPYATGLTKPIDLKNCGDDRLFAMQIGGKIMVINPDASLRPVPFLDISSKLYIGSDEQGLLGMCFSPNYKTDGKFYVYYTANISGQLSTIVEEYKVSTSDSNVAVISSALPILTQSQPYSNHKGGNLMFGKDGYLYINLGDGGGFGDPDGYGQSKTTFLGKILRIDVSNSSTLQPYIVPVTNPFYNDAIIGIKKEIWAYGFRNPFRASVDRLTGDLWLVDVGQDSREEIDFQSVNDPGGKNYGWNVMEGSLCFNPISGCNTSGLTLPTYEYAHPYGKSITGGYMYRSAQSKSLFGTYIFSDFIGKWIDGIKQSGGVISGTVNHLLTAAEQTTGNPLSFGEDRYGDLYTLFLTDGTIFKLTDTSYLRSPKAYFTPVDQGSGTFLFQGLQGRDITYQWLRNNVAIPGATSPDYSTSAEGIYTLQVTNSLGISDNSDSFILGALSLNLASFTAQKIPGNKISLLWKTASERNITGFTILRKQDNESTFSNIGFVKTKSVNGISNSELNYAFSDSLATYNSKVFYRLQIQNADGSFTYSDIRIINLGELKNNFTLFPNPAKDRVKIDLDNYTQPVMIVLYDNTGKKIKEQIFTQQTISIDVKGLRGIYILQLSNKDGGDVIRKKLLIE